VVTWAAMAQSVGMPLGDRIRFYRLSSHLTQVALANRAGITDEYLGLIERGARTPSVPVLYRLARGLGVSLSTLISEPDAEGETLEHSDGPALASAMMDFGRSESPESPDLKLLRDRLTALWQAWQTTPNRVTATAPHVPALVRDVGHATRAFGTPAEADQRREAFRIATDMYMLVRAVAKYIHRLDLMLLAADRCVQCAEQADDPLRLAGAKWNLAQALGSHNGADNAIDVATAAVEVLAPETKRDGPTQADALALTGSLHQAIAIHEGRISDIWAATSRLRNQVLPVALQVGEVGTFWMVFGPANARLHLLDVHMEAGDAAEALRLADELDMASLRSVERRATYLLSVARCYEYDRNDQALLMTLLRMEREAPDDLRYRNACRELVRGLLHRARPLWAGEVRELAGRMGLFGRS
jgi:transcriptional regulator with XRE-family HTH domain